MVYIDSVISFWFYISLRQEINNMDQVNSSAEFSFSFWFNEMQQPKFIVAWDACARATKDKS